MTHLVWDWNGTLLDDLALVVEATNASLTSAGGRRVSVEEHRRDFRRPVVAYYAYVLGREVATDEFADLDKAFHTAYRDGLPQTRLAVDAFAAIGAWPGTQSLLSMWFHDELLPIVAGHGLDQHLLRVDGLRAAIGGGYKAPHLAAHLAALDISGNRCVLIGDSVDDADAAAEVGARAVLYTGGITDEARLRETGWPVVSTLTAAVTLAMSS